MTLKRFLLPITAMALLALALLIPRAGLAAECGAAEYTWTPGKYYMRGELAYFDGQWYRARERHLGKMPSGATFSWETIEPPDCAAKEPVQEPPARDTPAAARPSLGNSETDEPAAGNPAQPAPTVGKDTSREKTKPEMAPSPEEKPDCSAIEAFSFGQSYLVGQRVRHQGQVYEAIRPTVSTMPGQDGAHHWQALDKRCPQ